MQPNKINTANPEAISYSTDELGFTALGLKLDGLDRMRVTLKIKVINRKFEHYLNNPDIANLAIRQSLDLFNDNQVEKLIRKVAERLEVGSSQIAKAIADMTNQMEVYRMQQIELQNLQSEKRKIILTEQQKTEAINYLKEKDLLQRTMQDIGKAGVIGEEMNRLLMYIIFTSRKRENPLHIICLAASGTGKTYLQEKVSELIPEEDRVPMTSLSANAFYYFGIRELAHKLILIEDLDGASGSMFPIRELQTKTVIIKRIPYKDTKGQTKTIELRVEGPVTVAGCTTHEKVYEDNANRCFMIYLDDSKEQDKKIMQYQSEVSAGLINTGEQKQWQQFFQNMQRVLQPVNIRNPFALQLQIPDEVFKPRRTNAHYLQFIEAITFIHQYQREQQKDKSGETYIETTIEDIEWANKLMKEVLLRKSDDLTGACRNYFERLKEHLQHESRSVFTNREISKLLRIPLSTVKRYHLDLIQNAYIKQASASKKDKSLSRTYQYEITSYEEYQQLKNRISSVLDEMLSKIKASMKKQKRA